MGQPKEPQPAKLFMSLIAASEEGVRQGVDKLVLLFGETDFFSERFPFNFTDYYRDEMGPSLFRHVISFRELIRIPRLSEIKGITNQLEGTLATPEGNRRVNIDPGYLCLQHVVLATTKGYAHRPYLRDGIYADLTLLYRDKSFQPLEWTYPDYKQEGILRLFNQMREKYRADLKKGAIERC